MTHRCVGQAENFSMFSLLTQVRPCLQLVPVYRGAYTASPRVCTPQRPCSCINTALSANNAIPFLVRLQASPSKRTNRTQLFSSVTADVVEADLWEWFGGKAEVDSLAPKTFASSVGPRNGCVATKTIIDGQEVCFIPEQLCVTRVDAEAQPLLGALAEARGEVVALALWLMAERSLGGESSWAPYLSTLPACTHSPILWPQEERSRLLRGSPVLSEAEQRRQAIAQEWADIEKQLNASFPAGLFNEQAFAEAVSVVLARSIFLPSAGCLALVPLLDNVMRSGAEDGVVVDYDAQRGGVAVLAQRTYRAGEEVCVYDGRPNGERLLALGTLEADNPADFLTLEQGLVATDRMYQMKKQIVEEVGLAARQEFPIYANRMPNQLLSYLRLSRVADPAQLAKVTFEQDVMINELNEYEVLQLLMGDCRERLAEYSSGGNMEDEVKRLQNPQLSLRERLACMLLLGEKKILRGTMDAVRNRLAPIRGVPIKGGKMVDPNQDFLDMFSAVEELPNMPKKVLNKFLSWARGEDDPDWR